MVGLRDGGRGPGVVTRRNLGSLQTGPGSDLSSWRESWHLEEGRFAGSGKASRGRRSRTESLRLLQSFPGKCGDMLGRGSGVGSHVEARRVSAT